MTGSALTLVVCGAPLAARTPDIVRALHAAGWSVTVVRSAATAPWPRDDEARRDAGDKADTDSAAVVGERERQRPNVVVACPLTFNTANKIAAGVMDTPATGILCDALGAGVPIMAVPMVNTRLWGHPVWAATLATLHAWGVTLIDPATGQPGHPAPVESGTGDLIAEAFDPHWIVTAVGAAPSCG